MINGTVLDFYFIWHNKNVHTEKAVLVYDHIEIFDVHLEQFVVSPTPFKNFEQAYLYFQYISD